jgi:hypothetical protein
VRLPWRIFDALGDPRSGRVRGGEQRAFGDFLGRVGRTHPERGAMA